MYNWSFSWFSYFIGIRSLAFGFKFEDSKVERHLFFNEHATDHKQLLQIMFSKILYGLFSDYCFILAIMLRIVIQFVLLSF